MQWFGKDAALYEAMHKTLVNNYMRLLEKGSYEYFVDKEPYGYLDEIIQMQALERSIKDDLSKKHAYRMVTLNFEEEADAEKVYLDLQDLMDKKWIGEYWASLEYYAEDGTYSHPHIHIFMRLANLMKKKSHIIREIHGTLQSKFSIGLSKNFIDVKSHKEKENGYRYVTRKAQKKTQKGTIKDLRRLARHGMPLLKHSDGALK